MVKSQQDISDEEWYIMRICHIIDQNVFSNMNKSLVICTRLDYWAEYRAPTPYENFIYNKGDITNKKVI